MDLCQGCGRELEIDELLAGDGLDFCRKIDFQGISAFFRQDKLESLRNGFQQGCFTIQENGSYGNIFEI